LFTPLSLQGNEDEDDEVSSSLRHKDHEVSSLLRNEVMSVASEPLQPTWELELSVARASLNSRRMLLTPTDLEYHSDWVLGQGSMGIVYKGTLKCSGSAGRPVAVKRLLSQEQAQDFNGGQMIQDAIRSMHIGAKLGAHPNVVEFVGVCDTTAAADPPALVYEFIDGIDIDEYFQVYAYSNTGAFRDVEQTQECC